MKRIACSLLAAILLALPYSAHADEASKRAKVQELFQVIHLEQTMKQVMASVMQQVKTMSQQQLAGAHITPDQQRKMDAFQEKVFALVNDSAGWQKIEPDYITLYSDTYTEEEIDGILNFYKSPIGQAMLAKTPELTAKGMQISQARMRAIQPQLMQLMQDFSHDVSTPSPTPTSK